MPACPDRDSSDNGVRTRNESGLFCFQGISRISVPTLEREYGEYAETTVNFFSVNEFVKKSYQRQKCERKVRENELQCIYGHMGADRYSTDLFHAGRFCPLQSRADEKQNTGKYPDEEHDGFLYRDALFLAGGFRSDVRQHSPFHRQTGSHDPRTLRGGKYSCAAGRASLVFVIFQTVFCATAATIVSGSMAERTNFKAYCLYSAAISLLVYPIGGHWAWGGGWLSGLGFHDFAGSAVVHNVGGAIACLGAWMLGPRIGKYDRDGKARAIPGHNMLAVALGVFILWFCWFGFNGGSTASMADGADAFHASLAFMNTNLAAAVATVVAMFFTWLRYGKPDVSMTLNAALAGLVAITAGCDCVTPFGAFVIGFAAGFLVVFSVEFFDNIAKIDDPVGAVSVHMVNGIWGTLAVGLFSTGEDDVMKGLFYGGGGRLLGVQAVGIAAIDVYVLVVMFIVFKLIDHFVGLRVPAG